MILEAVKHLLVKLEQLLRHVVQGDPAYLACQFHLKEIQKHQHTRSDVEEGA